MKQEMPFVTLDKEDEVVLRAYAEACDKEKAAKEKKAELRDQVKAILSREDLESTLVHDKFAYEVQYRRRWSPKCKTQSREIDVAGQYIQASVNDLADAQKRLTKMVQIDDLIVGHTIAISATAV